MATFQAVTNEWLAEKIRMARERVVYVAPAVSVEVVDSLVDLRARGGVAITLVLAGDEDAYRLGLGDPLGLEALREKLIPGGLAIRQQPGLRIGLLVADEEVAIWSPTPRSLEDERKDGEPNGIVLQGEVADSLSRASGGERRNPEFGAPEIGHEELSEDEIEFVVSALKENPPAPVVLSRKARFFSTRYQFVEVEVRGAEWTRKTFKISPLLNRYAKRLGVSPSALMNADLPQKTQEILESTIRPFESGKEIAVKVPVLVQGEKAFREDGSQMRCPMTEEEVHRAWEEVKSRYLLRLPGFGWLIRKKELAAFRREAVVHAEILEEWVVGFHRQIDANVLAAVDGVADAIRKRASAAGISRLRELDIDELRTVLVELFEGKTERTPEIRIITKEISWESSRDAEFTRKLAEVLPPTELEGWFKEFDAFMTSDAGGRG